MAETCRQPNRIQRQLCFDVPTPPNLHKTQRGYASKDGYNVIWEIRSSY